MALAGGGDVLGCFDDGAAGGGVFGEADLGAGFGVGADGLDAEAVGEHGVVANLGDDRRRELEAGSVAAVAVADVDEGAHLVEGHEVLDAVGEMLGDVAGVVGEGLGGVAGLPAALVFEGLREIPVEEGAVGLDAGGEELVDEAVVEVEALRVGRAGAVGKTRGQATEKRKALRPRSLHEGDVFVVAMVEVVGDVAGVALLVLPGVWEKVSQMEGPRPSSWTAPSTW